MGKQTSTRFRRVKTPTILQMEATECGAASLGIILAYFGRFVSLEDLRVECRVSRDGSNALYIKKTGEKFGLIGKGYQMTVAELRTLEPPFIVFWEMNHFLVVEGFRGDRVYLSDPATGRRPVDERTFTNSYTGIVFRFEPGKDFKKGGARPSTWKGIAKRIRGARTALIYVVLAGVALMACELVAASYNLVFVDQLLVEERWSWLRPLLLAMGVTAGFRLLGGWLQLNALRRLKLSLAVVHSSRFLWHALRLPFSFYQQRYVGDVSSRVEGNSLVAGLISGQLATTLVGLLMGVFYAAVMLAFDPLLAIVGVGIGCLNLAGISAASRLLADENLRVKQVMGKLYGSMMRSVQMIETIKASASEPEALVRLTGYLARVTNSLQLVGVANAFLVVMPPLLSLITTALVLWLGGQRVIEGVMSVGALLAVQTLMFNLNRPFGDLVRLGTSVQALQAELARLDDVLQYPQDPVFNFHAADGVEAGGTFQELNTSKRDPPRRLSGHLELRNVTFGYNRTVDEPLIHKFSMEIQSGSRVAIVGTSGSGKSTIGKLVAGLYRPWEGEILYDGFKIDEIPRDVFTSQVTLVDDQAFLFSGTVRDNLTLWDDTIPERDMVRAALDASVHRDLIARRGGYHATIAEGARNFSGGQRQRMEIARALIRNPSLMVLDEATSALDPVTEAIVDDNLRRRGCSCLIIAHRLSTIRDCDEIIVLRQGRVIQRGTHEQLMAESEGFYHELQTLHSGLAGSQEGDGDARGSSRSRILIPSSIAPVSTYQGANREASTNGRHDDDDDDETAHPHVDQVAAVRLLTELEPFGENVSTAGNHPLPLDDPGAVWRVVSGQVDVFYVEPPEPGRSRGSRRHLCRVEDGGSIFAIDGVRGDQRGGLLAVGVGSAKLHKFPKAELVRLSLDPDWRYAVADMIDDWIDRISRATDPGEPTTPALRLEPEDSRDISAGQCVSTRSRVLWLRTSGEGLRVYGRLTIPDCPYGSRFPVSPHTWLTSANATEVHARDTETLLEDGDPWVGLKRFHKVVLDVIAQARGHERAVRYARMASSALRDESLVSAAMCGLARLAGPNSTITPVREGRDRLEEACRAVGAAMNLDVSASPIDQEHPVDVLRTIARASGFRTRRIKLEGDWWRSDGGPFLAYLVDDSRPVALIPTPGGGYEVVDPSKGSRLRVSAEVARRLQPAGVMFYRTLPGNRPRAADLFRFCLPTIRGELKTLLIAGMISGLLGMIVPAVTAILIDDAIPRADHGQLKLLCGFLIAIGFAAASFQAVQGLALVRVKGKLESELLPAVWDRLLKLPTRFFGDQEAGDLALRAMGMLRVIEVLASTSAASLLVAIFSLSNVLVLFYLNWRLALIAAGMILVSPLVTVAILPWLWTTLRATARAQGKISGLLLALLGGIARLRVAGAERRAFARWAEHYRRQLALMIRYQSLSDSLILFGDVWPMIILMVVFAVVIGSVPQSMTAGDFLAFNLAMSQLMMALIGLARIGLPMLDGLEQYERFRPILEASPEGAEFTGEPITLGGAIRLSHVSFRYSPDGPLILDDVNIQIRAGEFVAIVGPSGSGKSTILRLLLGFETPAEGIVSYDGREISTLDVQEIRRQLGVVLQDAQLFPGDIYSNIVGLSSHLSKDDAWEAAELAGLADDITQMPMKIHTVITEGGGGLSSGQRQRLIIARALAGRPKILLLDEATSALDNRSQAVVSRSIHTRLAGTSRVAIAHRLSTVVEADRIYVVSEGKVVQSGSYAQLIAEDGLFHELARRQTLS